MCRGQASGLGQACAQVQAGGPLQIHRLEECSFHPLMLGCCLPGQTKIVLLRFGAEGGALASSRLTTFTGRSTEPDMYEVLTCTGCHANAAGHVRDAGAPRRPGHRCNAQPHRRGAVSTSAAARLRGPLYFKIQGAPLLWRHRPRRHGTIAVRKRILVQLMIPSGQFERTPEAGRMAFCSVSERDRFLHHCIPKIRSGRAQGMELLRRPVCLLL